MGLSRPTVRIVEASAGSDGVGVEVLLLDDDRQLVLSAQARVSTELIPREQEDLRWYMEEYLNFPEEPAPLRAKRIETRMAELGEQLFRELFGDRGARQIWCSLSKIVQNARIEIASPATSTVPWELARAAGATPLPLQARAFVHVSGGQLTTESPIVVQSDRLRVLLICRPAGAADVPFRSVASRIIAGVGDELGRCLQIDVLRPPSRTSLENALMAAARNGRPYHIVHFDGHGI